MQKPDLTPDEAREMTEQVKRGIRALQVIMLELFERKAYKALGYRGWRAYCSAELKMDSNYVEKTLMAGRVAREVGAVTLTAGAARVLRRLPTPQERRKAYEEVIASGKRATTNTLSLHICGRNGVKPSPARLIHYHYTRCYRDGDSLYVEITTNNGTCHKIPVPMQDVCAVIENQKPKVAA